MTGKELAEEYAEHNQGKYTNEFGNLYHAYLTGYNAGSTSHWHDLRKNPNDLPKDGASVLANNILTTECVKFKKEENGNCWRHDYFELCNVVYWKELKLPEEVV